MPENKTHLMTFNKEAWVFYPNKIWTHGCHTRHRESVWRDEGQDQDLPQHHHDGTLAARENN